MVRCLEMGLKNYGSTIYRSRSICRSGRLWLNYLGRNTCYRCRFRSTRVTSRIIYTSISLVVIRYLLRCVVFIASTYVIRSTTYSSARFREGVNRTYRPRKEQEDVTSARFTREGRVTPFNVALASCFHSTLSARVRFFFYRNYLMRVIAQTFTCLRISSSFLM